MNKYSYNFVNLIVNTIISAIIKPFVKVDNKKLPPTIGEYKYVKTIQRSTEQDTSVTIYQNDVGKKFVAKIWRGRFKNYSYYSLINEYLSYRSLHQIINRVNKQKQSHSHSVSIPNLVGLHESSNQLVLLIEYVSGVVGVKLSDKKLLSSYVLINKYLDNLTDYATESDLAELSKRIHWHYIISYFVALPIAIITHPGARSELIKGLLIVLTQLSSLYSAKSTSIVHRDLNFENIIVHKNNIYLIDLQFLALTYKVSEYVNTLRYCWDKNRLTNEVKETVQSVYADDPNSIRLFRVLSIISSTQGLAAPNFSKNIKSRIRMYLKDSL